MPNGNGVLTQGEDDDKSVRIWDLRPVLERWKDSTSVQTEIFPPLTLEETDPLELPWRELDANQVRHFRRRRNSTHFQLP